MQRTQQTRPEKKVINKYEGRKEADKEDKKEKRKKESN
jgi:hypothetical protein